MQDLLDDLLLVALVIDRKIIRYADLHAMAPEDIDRGRVKGLYEYGIADGAYEPDHPEPHLFRGLVGKGNGENMIGLDFFDMYQMGDAVRYDPGFSGARPCKYE